MSEQRVAHRRSEIRTNEQLILLGERGVGQLRPALAARDEDAQRRRLQLLDAREQLRSRDADERFVVGDHRRVRVLRDGAQRLRRRRRRIDAVARVAQQPPQDEDVVDTRRDQDRQRLLHLFRHQLSARGSSRI